jgi:hypothetical protein
MITLAVPVSVFRVECDIASGRPFAEAERTVLKSIAAGNADFEALKHDLALHPRIVAECLTALFEAGIIELAKARRRIQSPRSVTRLWETRNSFRRTSGMSERPSRQS